MNICVCLWQDFEHAVQTLTHSGGLCIENDQVLIRRSICKHTTFLSQMFEPFLVSYWVLCQYLLTLTSDVNGRPLPKKQPVLARDAQQLGIRLLQENLVKHYEILSLDIISNGLTVLADLGAVYRDKRSVCTSACDAWSLQLYIGHYICIYLRLVFSVFIAPEFISV